MKEVAQENLAKIYGASNGERYDIRQSFDKERKNDPYFYYLFKDATGLWKAYPKKYVGDKREIVEVSYFLNKETSYTELYDISKYMYDRALSVNDPIKNMIVPKLAAWGMSL